MKEIIIVMVIIAVLALIMSYSAVTTGHVYPVDRCGICKQTRECEGSDVWDLRFHRDGKKTGMIEGYRNG